MIFSVEKSVFIGLITVLLIMSIVLPVSVLYNYKPRPRYVFLGNKSDNSSFKIVTGIPKELEDFKHVFKGGTENQQNSKDSTYYLHGYVNVTELYQYFNDFASVHRNWFMVEKIGKSAQYIDINAVKLTKDRSTSKPIILIISGLYGSDWNSILIIIETMNNFVKNITNSTKPPTWLDRLQIHFVPVLNPDGYIYSLSGPPIDRAFVKSSHGINIVKEFEKRKEEPEVQALMDHVEHIKTRLIAVFILFSSDQNGLFLTTPVQLTKNEERYEFLKHKIEACTNSITTLEQAENHSGYIDDWLAKIPRSNPLFVLNYQANFRPNIFTQLNQTIQKYEKLLSCFIETICDTLEKNKKYLV